MTRKHALVAVALIVVAAAAAGLVATRQPLLESNVAGAVDTSGLRLIAGGTYEASGLAAVPGDSQFLFVDDGRRREIFLLTLTRDGQQAGEALALPIPADVTDMEGITGDGRYFYVVGSQSKKTGFDGDGLVRFTYDPGTKRVDNVLRIAGLKAWLAENVAELRGTAQLLGDEVLNIEGLAWDPTRRRLLLGLRAPVIGDKALVVPLALSDTTAPFSRENLRVDGETIRLPLGGAGIRGIEWDPVNRAFLVITGAALNDEDRDFRVFEWDGQGASIPREIASYARRLKPEGIAQAASRDRSLRVVVFDVGQLAVMPE